MADFDDIQSYKTDTNYEKDLSVSARLEKAKNSTDWGSFYANLNMNDVLKASKDPVNRIYNVQDLENITSDAGTIAYDTFRKGVLDLASIGDKAEMALGNTLAGISGDSFGTEMRNRAYDNLMKTMEDSQFIDSNYGDAETWTARFVGGGMSMAEMLAIGAMSGPVGLGAFVGTLSLSDGALNDMAKYEEEHGNLDGYETDPVNLALDYGNAVFQIGSELIGGTGRLLNGRVLKAGKTGTAIVKESLTNFLQESLQGAASDLTEVLKGNQDLDVLADNVTGYIKDGIVAGTLGGAIGGAFYKVNKGRAIESIDKINQKLHPEMSEQERQDLNEDIFTKTEEEGIKSFAPQIIAHAEAVNDKGAIRDNIQKKVEFMYRDAEDMSEKQKAQAVEATTTVELENILYDSIERKIPLTAHPLLKGEINELGWFRDGIPANRRTEIDSLNNELVELRRQQRELNQAQEKDYEKLEELETKIEQFQKDLPEKIKDLVVADKAELRKMLDEQRARVQDKIAQREFVQKIQKRVQADKDKIAEQMAKGAEKAQAKRETSETAQQIKEAKIRNLKEQREISSAIKRLKAKQRQERGEQTYKPIPTDEAYDMLIMAGYTGDQIKRMDYQDIVDALEKFAQTEPVYIAQEAFDIAAENERLDAENPEYTGDTVNIEPTNPLSNKIVFHGTNYNRLAQIQRTGLDPQQGKVKKNGKEKLIFFTENAKYAQSASQQRSGGESFVIAFRSPADTEIEQSTNQGQKYPDLISETAISPDNLYIKGKDGNWYKLSDFNLYYGESDSFIGKNPIKNINDIPKISTERTVYNSNGDRIAKSEAALKNFWNWFGDSKVVDDKGRPLVVYHGSPNEFDTFDNTVETEKERQFGAENGFFFTDKEKVARRFIPKREKAKADTTNEKIEKFGSVEKFDDFGKRLIKDGKALREELGDDNLFQDLRDAYFEIKNKESGIDYSYDSQAYGLYRVYLKAENVNEFYGEDLGVGPERDFALRSARANGKDGVIIYKADTGAGIANEYIVFESNQIKSTENRGTFSPDTGNIYKQSKATQEKGKDEDRGAYIPEYRFIAKTANLDASTLAHELAHDWGQENFRWARSGRASEDFMKAWGAVEKAIGITDKDTYFTYAASEKFARAYEGWLMQRKDWADILKINNDDERKAVADAMEDYRQQIVDIYESLNHKYFKMAWGKVGELKPELQEWFDRSNKFDSLDARVARGEITEEKAAEEKLGDMVVAATDASINSLSTQDLQAVDAIEQLDKYEQQLKETAKQFEVEGGNINRLQKRLDDIALAKNMIANNEALKRHDTHRDMIKAAEAADEFVRTRLEDALAIINGKMAEQDGIYASELYTALERLATEQGDYNLINELRNSKVATDLAKELGQRVAGFRNYKGDGDLDIMSALKSLDKQYEKAYNDKAKEQVETEIKVLESELAQQDKAADAKLDDFLKEMECQ